MKYWLGNARLETGVVRDGARVVATETGLFDMLIDGGKIVDVKLAGTVDKTGIATKNAKGFLVVPSFVEKHIHLDKTKLGAPWSAVTPVNSIVERFSLETDELRALPVKMADRTRVLLDTELRNGTTAFRSHIDVHPRAGLEYLETVQSVLQEYAGKLDAELVAFPQHGLLRSDSVALVREALQSGATLIGGVDPGNVDGDVERSLETMFDLAVAHDAGVDIHVHDRGEIGKATFWKLLELTREAKWQGRVAASHAFALGDFDGNEKIELFGALAAERIAIVTSVPIGGQIPPINDLEAAGVTVHVGCDNVYDCWSPYGNADLLERVGRLGELTGRVTEQALGQSLGLITNGVMPLDKAGEQVWPMVGDDANLVLVDASCTAEMVARRSARMATIFRGNVVAGEL
ncbi:amidohydrolase family protein [Listeria weihenstephanensis FSL R9-0317]|uniref:Deaminase n=1 Tax=Listeria weihenstephanensis TaxID=1006155 RepID=A0A1S7FQL8_9LIST|nr:amidohydrolase [Listeria weihenstephanensis]AQY49703.1 deaminase [Listeria weihenstephanensis]EUJ40993.1 amidohydrolase family protein [Listeria weihenstephanensis FSL R9-0317]